LYIAKGDIREFAALEVSGQGMPCFQRILAIIANFKASSDVKYMHVPDPSVNCWYFQLRVYSDVYVTFDSGLGQV
jgi:hypothetical protein